MLSRRPWLLILIGFILLVVGWAIPFLIVIKVVESNFPMLVISFIASTLGLFMGIAGAAMVGASRRRRDD